MKTRFPLLAVSLGTAAQMLLAGLVAFSATSRTPARQGSNEDCQLCHADPTLQRANGTSVFLDEARYAASIHGQLGAACVDCHTDPSLADLPHPENLARASCAACHESSQQEYQKSIHGQLRIAGNGNAAGCSDCHGSHDILPRSDPTSPHHPLNLAETCGKCHSQTFRQERADPSTANRNIYDLYTHSTHGRALKKAGLTVTATCGTCHGAHDTRPGSDPQSRVSRQKVAGLCGQCHEGIYHEFAQSVHGRDYLAGNTDVPVCTDCHGEHSIQGPESAASSVSADHVAATCSRCHEDMELARTYGLGVDRLRTYFGSYHGIAMRFGMSTVAQCASCHGVHDILPSSDPKSKIHADNLAATCGGCHVGAGANFSLVRIHQVNPRQDNVWAYWIRVFYISLTTLILGLFVIFISADLYGRTRRARAGKERP